MSSRRAAAGWIALGIVGLAGAVQAEPPAAPRPAFWTDDELRRIDLGLEAINCDRKDLQFQKRPIDDPFRLSVVNRVLDDPLSIGGEAEGWDGVARTGDPLQLLARAAAALDLPMPAESPAPKMASAPAEWPKNIFPSMSRMVAALEYAQDACKRLRAPWGDQADAILRKAFLTQVEKPVVTLPGGDVKDEGFLAEVRKLDRTAAVEAAQALLAAIPPLVAALREAKPETIPLPKGDLRLPTAAGFIVITGTGDDVHEEGDDVVLVIDLGGNDTWKHGARARGARTVSVAIDLSGDDRYVGREDLSFGGALGGVAIQWDGGGNDLYDAGHASLGAAVLGVGILVDEGGDDVYRCKDFGEGAGAFGIGILVDRAGNDLYHADLYGQGFASTWGCGVLAEIAGNDAYDAGGVHSDEPLHRDRFQTLSQGFSIGMRPDASGGVGVLVDVTGNDRYAADIYGQGASYWFSLGILVDDDGNDTYTLGHYGQGAGIHLSAGMLLDRAGQDLYYAQYGVGVGGAHDFAVGFLVDRGGDDQYCGSGASQGSSLTNSVAMLLDDGGDDGYMAVHAGASQGGAGAARDTGGLALLLDAGGADAYGETTRDGGVWTSGPLGAGLDEPTPADAAKVDPMAAAITKEAATALVDRDGRVAGPDGKPVDDLDKLWAIGIRWQVGDERVIGPIARERLVALGTKTLDRAKERLGSKDGLELECCEAMFKAFPRDQVASRLLDATGSKDVATRRSAIRFLGTIGISEAVPRLVALLADAEVRPNVLRALGLLKQAPKEVVPFLHSAKESEGVAVTVCLAAVGDAASIDLLIGALAPETAFPVRLAAEQRLAGLKDAAVPALAQAAAGAKTVRERRSALRALGATGSPRAVDSIWKGLLDPEPWIRASAVQAAGALLPTLPADLAETLAASLADVRAREKDPLVRRIR